MKSHCVILLSLLLLSLSTISAAALAGGWTPIKNINDPHVKEIADFAVTEHNKQSGEKLKLESVVKGESQVVSGTNYRLVLVASSKNYQAVVYEKPWLHFKKLTSFELA
ncbi:hypothetical protein TanjilG_31737 [Lupinus angustifolius]|uniref:Cystatin domain-containing protein n=1 Tax=Lupinus angustifolius TaxID=3871 RepID=A0A4P1RMG9_LUPAN|nr:PREDICTED: cysteine proteinase inhibitor 5-like [Lupinus angustifolius]OIW13848.1 hypothetical protein TanjilG_31737 [Lupinus angustifolius]